MFSCPQNVKDKQTEMTYPTPGLKPTSFINLTPPVVSLLPPGLFPLTFAWTVSSKLLVFLFYIFLIFRFWAVC